jgi:hypothetical protein
MRRLLMSLFLALPLLGQLPPGVSRVHFLDSADAVYLAATPDDTIWLAPFLTRQMGRLDVHGTAQSFNMPPGWTTIRAAGVGPEGALWLGAHGFIARVDPVTNAFLQWPLGAGHTPTHILAGPDGNLWFAEEKGLVVRMRPDGEFLGTYDSGGSANGAAFGSDGALYLSMTTKVVRITFAGERTELPAATQYRGYAGRDFFWHGSRSIDEPERAPHGVITKTSFRGETLATYHIDMTPLASDASGNLWLRARTAEGDVIGQLTPLGVLTRFGPLPSLPWTDCHPSWYGGLAFLADGRVAMAEYYPDIPRSLPAPAPPCAGVRRPADFKNTVTIFDPWLVPVLSVESLNRTPRRRGARQ